MGKKIGIDLGTTYSCVACLNDKGDFEVVLNQEGNNTTPSVVFFDPDGQTVVVGEQAKPAAMFAIENFVQCIKSRMSDKDYTINIMDTDYSPVAISSIILRKLRADTEAYLNDSIEGCVITCPAYFGTYARSATLEAAKVAGLNVYTIIDEPIAAALAYARIKNEDVNKTVLIYDLGGGTFDCTLLKMEFVGDQKNINIISSNGDPTIGGMNWEHTLLDYVIEEFCRETGEDEDSMKNDIECMVELSMSVERIKKQLTARETVKLPVRYNGNKEIVEITRDTFDSLTEHILEHTIVLTNEMLSKNNFTLDDFDEIILVGGSTYMPQVEKRLMIEYGKPIFAYRQNELVAMGAALVANDFDTPTCEKPRVADESIGIKVNYGGEIQIVNLVIKGRALSESSNIVDYLDFSVGYGDDAIKSISVTLIKNQNTQRFCNVDNQCTEWACVDFELIDYIKEDSVIGFKYNMVNQTVSATDTLELVDKNGHTIAQKKVVWKKRAFLGKKKPIESLFDLSNIKLS